MGVSVGVELFLLLVEAGNACGTVRSSSAEHWSSSPTFGISV